MTKKKKQHFFFKLWVKARGFVALSVVLLGVLVGLVTLLLPFDGLYKDRLEKFLQEQWGMDVTVEAIQGSWKGFGPHFQLKGLKLKGAQTIEVEDTTLSLNVYEYFVPAGKTGINLSISQADLAMVQSEKGHNITINNDRDEAKFTEMLDKILTTGALRVSELNLNIANDQGEVLLNGLKAGFLLEQDDFNRAMSLQVGLEGDSTLLIKSVGPKSKQLTKDADWHLTLTDFDVSEFNELQDKWSVPSFVLNGAVWLTSNDGVLTDASAEISWQFGGVSGMLTWLHQGEDQQWQSHFKLSELKSGAALFEDINIQLERNGEIVTAVSDDVDMIWLNQIMKQESDDWPDLTVAGKISDLRLDYNLTEVQFNQGSMAFMFDTIDHETFLLSQLGGELKWQSDELLLMLDGKDGQLTIPSFMRGKMQWSELLAQVAIPLDDKQRVIVNQFWCDCTDFVVDAQGQYWLDKDSSMSNVTLETTVETDVEEETESQPESSSNKMLQLQAKVEQVDVAALHGYWPHQVWKPKTIEWLDSGLKSGTVTTGYLFQFGQLLPKAFENDLANFMSRSYLEDVTLKFNPEWPLATDIDGVAIFTGLGFSAEVTEAKSKAVILNAAEIKMESYKQPFIDLSLQAQTQNNTIFEYLALTPVTKNMPLDSQMTLSGKQRVDLTLEVPLQKEVKVIPMGEVTFTDAGFDTEHLNLSKLNGKVELDGFDLKIKKLDAELMSHDVNIAGIIKTQTSEGVQLDVQLVGDMEAEQLMAQQEINLPINGLSEWQIEITNPSKQLHLRMVSDLQGTTINLPAPLNKVADKSKHFEIECDLPCAQSDIRLNYGDEIISLLEAGDAGLVIKQLQFKEVIKAVKDGLLLGGHINQLDVDKWLAKVKEWSQSTASDNTKGSWPLPEKSFTLDVDEMIFLARRFHDVKLDVVRLSDAYQIDIDNKDMKGRFLVADDLASKGLVADFEYLHWKEASTEDLSQSSQVAEELPDLHIFSETFSYLGMPFGELRLEMRNVIDGMRVETMSLVSDTSNIQISGDWVSSENGLGVSDFSIVMTSEKIATFLSQMDFDPPITNAQTLIQLYASWPGTPSMFDLKNIDGTLNLKMGEGEVLDTKPGFGRVLGLFSLTNLPRRLLLDFKDVMAEGLHFDSMEGQFVLKDGYAETDDFIIKASAANIKVKGLTGFADKSYHQTILVEPQVGKTFPTLGAIAGGAVGAAAGFFVQGLLNKKLKSENRITYQVTGSWDEPIIEVIEDE